jgi:voltage-gated potassium channel
VFPLSSSTRAVLLQVDNAICGVFLYDFIFRLVRAEDKLRFLRWGWLDLVSSIPTFQVFRVARAARIIRVFRLLRGFRSAKTIGTVLFSHRAKGTLATAVFLSILLIVFSSIAIQNVETDAGSNIRGPVDAVWWSITTITTVGYGDRYPITEEGRFIGVLLMLSGIGLFSILSGAFAAWFTEKDLKEKESEAGSRDLQAAQLAILIAEVKALRAEVGAVSMREAGRPFGLPG